MAIVTQTMLENRVGQAELVRLTDDDNSGGLDAAVMNQIIAEGEAEIMGYIAQRYALPLSLTDANTLQTVTAKVADVTVFRLYLHRDQAASETLTTLWKAAIVWAEKVANGTLGLVGETLTGTSPTGGKIIVKSEDAVVTRESMEGL